jgi:hypothetical protein
MLNVDFRVGADGSRLEIVLLGRNRMVVVYSDAVPRLTYRRRPGCRVHIAGATPLVITKRTTPRTDAASEGAMPHLSVLIHGS